MRLLTFTFIICLAGPAQALERDENSNWVEEWNTLAGTIEQKEECARKMMTNDYVRYGREAVGLIDKRASSTPTSDLEKEVVWFILGAHFMEQWQRYLNLPENTYKREELTSQLPYLRSRAEIYSRKLMELPNPRMMSRLLIARVQELGGYRYANDIEAKIPRGAKFWEFVLDPSHADNVYFLNDLREEYRAAAQDKRGGRAISSLRAVCAGLLICLGGARFDDEIVIREMNSVVGIRVVRDGEFQKIAGLKEW